MPSAWDQTATARQMLDVLLAVPGAEVQLATRGTLLQADRLAYRVPPEYPTAVRESDAERVAPLQQLDVLPVEGTDLVVPVW